jgi:hypothetical protein
MQTNPEIANDKATPGPAKFAAAVPVKTKIPVPIVLSAWNYRNLIK